MEFYPFNQRPPRILYHYTSQVGLIGILRKREIWASKIHYLNDSKEFSLALDLARHALKTRASRESSQREINRLEVLLDEIDSIRAVNICVCSFSEVGDSLSQWRGYTGGGAGFSLGFSTQWLLHFASNAGFSLYPCVYNPEHQEFLINELITQTLVTNFNMTPGYLHPNQPRTFVVLPMRGDFAQRLTQLAPLIKDASFLDEKEWRLISNPISSLRLDHRPGESMITPFFRLVIGNEKEFDCLEEIVVGPTPHPELSKGSVESVWYSAQVSKHPNIKVSAVPFRNW